MDRIEPSYRAGLARAFATRFSAAELDELNRFFSTPVGARYAGESMLIYADPQVMAAMNELMSSTRNPASGRAVSVMDSPFRGRYGRGMIADGGPGSRGERSVPS